jgi:hypothetical protein
MGNVTATTATALWTCCECCEWETDPHFMCDRPDSHLAPCAGCQPV